MSETRDMVREFHAAFGVEDGREPCVPAAAVPSPFTIRTAVSELRYALQKLRSAASRDVRALRLALLTEELVELSEASIERDSVGALDALCDLQYVLDGTVLAYGMDRVADEAFRRVHASNMSKLGADGRPVLDDTGKIRKGPHYAAVKLEDLVT